MKSNINPMQRAHQSRRCHAHSKRAGFLCKDPAVRGWTVCRMHGAGGSAASGAENPKYKEGLRTKQMQEARSLTRFLQRATA